MAALPDLMKKFFSTFSDQGITGDAAHTYEQNFAALAFPEDRHDEQGGSGATAADIHFQTTDSTNFNEHIFEVVASTVTLEVMMNADSAAYKNVWVEEMDVTAPQANLITAVALPVGIYKLKGNFHSIKATQTATAAASSTLSSYCK